MSNVLIKRIYIWGESVWAVSFDQKNLWCACVDLQGDGCPAWGGEVSVACLHCDSTFYNPGRLFQCSIAKFSKEPGKGFSAAARWRELL